MKTQGQINNLITLIDLRLGRNQDAPETVKEGFILFKECLLSEDENHDLIVVKGNSERSRAIASLAIDWMQGILPRDSDILGIIGK